MFSLGHILLWVTRGLRMSVRLKGEIINLMFELLLQNKLHVYFCVTLCVTDSILLTGKMGIAVLEAILRQDQYTKIICNYTVFCIPAKNQLQCKSENYLSTLWKIFFNSIFYAYTNIHTATPTHTHTFRDIVVYPVVDFPVLKRRNFIFELVDVGSNLGKWLLVWSYSILTRHCIPKLQWEPCWNVRNDRQFADDISRRIFVNEKFCILIKIPWKLVPKLPIDHNPALI